MAATNSSNVSIEYSFGDLQTLLDIEDKFQFDPKDCQAFRTALNNAAGVLADSFDSNLDWRYRIARWLLKATDELNLSRETGLIALMYLDRFMLSRSLVIDKRTYQAASITSLFVAAKLYEKKRLKMARLQSYTQHSFSRHDIMVMEIKLFKANEAYMYPPTSGAFALMLLNGVTSTHDSITTLINNIQFLVQLAACDFFFLSQRQSIVAVAAIIVALQQSDLDDTGRQACFGGIEAAGLNARSKEASSCIERLNSIYEDNQYRINNLDNGTGSQPRKRAGTTPVRRVTPTADVVAKYSGSKRTRDER